MRRAALVLAAAVSAPALAADMRVGIRGGGLVSMASEADAALAPLAQVLVEAPVADAAMAPTLLVGVDLSALPGEQLSLEEPATWRSVEFRVGLDQPIARALHAHVYGEAGFATRLPGERQPLHRTARWAAAGVRFGGLGSRGTLQVGLGGDQRLDGLWRPAVTVTGSVTLWEAKDGVLKGGGVMLAGSAVLGFDFRSQPPAASARRDAVRAGLVVGR